MTKELQLHTAWQVLLNLTSNLATISFTFTFYWMTSAVVPSHQTVTKS